MIRRLLAIDPGILKVVPEAAKIFLTSSRRCGLCGGVFRDDLPCRLCLECWDRLPRWEGDVCRVCKKPLMPSGPVREEVRRDRMHCCDCCRRSTFLDGTVYIALYSGYLKEAIRDLKYRGCVHLGDALGNILGEVFEAGLGSGFRGVVIPIPLHPNRLGERGFNQAESIARGFAWAIGARLVADGLEKVRDTADQKRLAAGLRARNVKGAFAVRAAPVVTGKDVTLVDDVMTTGSTLNEAARVLRSSGARRVFGAVCASGLGQPCGCRQGDRILLDGVE